MTKTNSSQTHGQSWIDLLYNGEARAGVSEPAATASALTDLADTFFDFMSRRAGSQYTAGQLARRFEVETEAAMEALEVLGQQRKILALPRPPSGMAYMAKRQGNASQWRNLSGWEASLRNRMALCEATRTQR
jgi:hypothetical protein